MSGRKAKPKSARSKFKQVRRDQRELEAENESLLLEVWVKMLQVALLNGALGKRPKEEDLNILWAGWHAKVWLQKIDPKTGKPFADFVDFCMRSRPDGLGTEPDAVMMFLAHDVLPSVRAVGG